MRSFLIITSVIIAIPLGLKLYWSLAYPSYSIQRTLTINVMTPDGPVKSVNTVQALYTQGPKIFPDGAAGGWRYYGEAPVVDLGNGQYLFAMFGDSVSVVFDAAEHAGYMDTGNRWSNLRKLTRSRGVVWDVPIDIMPELVTFRDQSIFKTAMIVDPTNLAATFGPGFEMIGMTVEVTREPTTSGLIAPLFSEWIEERRPPLRIPRKDSHLILTLSYGKFWSTSPR